MSMRSVSLVAAGILLPTASAAHPGHGPELGLWHHLSDPFHLAAYALVVGVGVLAVTTLRRLARRAPARARRDR